MDAFIVKDRRDLGGILADLSARQTSVYLQVVRKTGAFIGIGMLEGMIVYLKCGSAEGKDVLPILGQLGVGDRILRWSPRPNQVSPTLPDMAEVFKALATEMPAAAGVSFGAMAATPAEPRLDARGGIESGQFSQAILPLVRQYLGPIADLILDEALQAYPRRILQEDATKIIRALARNLRDVRQAQEFVVAAQAKWKALM
jgi:hypothetical protein